MYSSIMEIKKTFKCPLGHEEITQNFTKEIYEENEYDRFGIKIEKGDIVLDAGSNVGIFTQYALDMGASQVLAYECDESLFECYNENITDNRANYTMGFVSYNNYDLDRILDQHQIKKIDFAKIDIEGAEWELLEKIEVEDMKKVDKWAIEFHTHHFNPNVDCEQKANYLWSFLKILEKFNVNGFNTKYEHIHKGWDVVHLYASK